MGRSKFQYLLYGLKFPILGDQRVNPHRHHLAECLKILNYDRNRLFRVLPLSNQPLHISLLKGMNRDIDIFQSFQNGQSVVNGKKAVCRYCRLKAKVLQDIQKPVQILIQKRFSASQMDSAVQRTQQFQSGQELLSQSQILLVPPSFGVAEWAGQIASVCQFDPEFVIPYQSFHIRVPLTA